MSAAPSDNGVVIRPAVPPDVDALIELASTTFRDTYRGTDDPADIAKYIARNFTRPAFEEVLADDSMLLVVSEIAGRLVGYLQIRRSAAPACVTGPRPIELARLYLRQETQGKGLGAALMRHVHAEARRHACETIWLVVYSRNDQAREFYRRWGFVDVGLKDFQFGGTVYSDPVMSAPVQPP
jgi:ribosomal protein S18 acetylase RimI-like enzyme